jgi:hypothetical protein
MGWDGEPAPVLVQPRILIGIRSIPLNFVISIFAAHVVSHKWLVNNH